MIISFRSNNGYYEVKMVDDLSWDSMLTEFIKMLRMKGCEFTDEDVIHRLDELLNTNCLTEAYTQGRIDQHESDREESKQAGLEGRRDEYQQYSSKEAYEDAYYDESHQRYMDELQLGFKPSYLSSEEHEGSREEIRSAGVEGGLNDLLAKQAEMDIPYYDKRSPGVGEQGHEASLNVGDEDIEDFRIR